MLPNKKFLVPLDEYLNINHFLSLKDEFYYFYSKHHRLATSTWTAGSIPVDSQWEYFASHPILYHMYHKNKNFSKVEYLRNTDNEALAKYLQLHFGAFNPYKILKLKNDNFEYKDFVDSWEIMNWVDTLPFHEVNCVDIFYSEHYFPLGFHRDYNYFPIEDGNNSSPPDEITELIWFRFDLNRNFFIYEFDDNGHIVKEHPAIGYSITFDDRDWHGNTGYLDTSSITIKVEGKFIKEFKETIYG